jgi:hypothetical protein
MDLAHRPWRCHWIWAPNATRPSAEGVGPFGSPPESAEQDVLLRRTFTLAAVPANAPLRITADSRYVLWVNGAEVSRGPVRGDASKLSYDFADLAPQLRAGENVLAVRAHWYATPTSWWAPARPSLVLGRRGVFACELELGAAGVLGSDASWKALLAEAFTPVPRRGVSLIPCESLDARKLPADWRALRFDDSAWPAAEEIRALSIGAGSDPRPPSTPYGALRPRPIPQLRGETYTPQLRSARAVRGAAPGGSPVEAALADEKSEPVRELALGPALPLRLEARPGETLSLLFDWERVVCGLIALEVEAEPGVTFDFSGREELSHEAVMGLPAVGFRYVARGGADAFESFDPLGFRYAVLSVREATRPVTLRRLAVHERLYPIAPGASFACSDPALDEIYRIGIRTVALTAHDAYLDCPTREQRGWVGDSVVHQMVHLTTNADWGLARWHPRMAFSPRPDGMLPMAAGGDAEALAITIPEWALHWVRSVWNLWRYTGDRDLVRGLLPGVESVLRWFLPYRDASGLVRHVEQWVLIELGRAPPRRHLVVSQRAMGARAPRVRRDERVARRRGPRRVGARPPRRGHARLRAVLGRGAR